MRPNDLWLDLERQIVTRPGYLKRRYSPEIKANIFVGLKIPDRSRMLILKLSAAAYKYLPAYSELKGLKLEYAFDPDSTTGELLLTLILIDNECRDIFSVLTEDIICEIQNLIEERAIIGSLVERVNKWQSLFERHRDSGLTAEEQCGLYGELYFLRKMCHAANTANAFDPIESWVGPSAALQDFQMKGGAVEVKTSSANSPQRIHIANERQLDVRGLRFFYLYFLSVNRCRESGESLPQIIGDIRNSLSSDPPHLASLNAKLVEAGYLDTQANLYDKIGYELRKEYLFKVEGAFPRILESDLPSGVGDVSYSIDVSCCLPFLSNEQEFLIGLDA